jgi:hypothetical protein
MSQLDRGPIFIVGAPRSGTTLLRYVLCSHPRIYIPPESNFIPRLLPRDPQRPLSPEDAIRAIEAILAYRTFFKDWGGEQPNPVTFVGNLPDLLPATLFDELYSAYAHQFGATRWGDKSPIYTMHVDAIARAFPTAQFVHIIRDARDVALSMRRTYRGARFFYIDVYYSARSWAERIRRASASGEKLGPLRYFELRYEDLAASPEPVIRDLCGFLGEDFEPAMTEPYKEARAHYHSKGIHAPTRQPLTTSRSGRWNKDMSPADQRLVQAVVGDLLRDHHYETLILGRLPLAERFRLGALWGKYQGIQAIRAALRAAGVFHPTWVLDGLLRVPTAMRKRSAITGSSRGSQA